MSYHYRLLIVFFAHFASLQLQTSKIVLRIEQERFVSLLDVKCSNCLLKYLEKEGKFKTNSQTQAKPN